jgi:type IV secretion system protein VirB1
MAHVVQVESSRNPYAIGVVGGRLQRQPRSLAEAVSTMRMLEDRGFNYSVGLAQVNRINFERFGLDDPEERFDACRNLLVGSQILAECLQRHDGRWGDAFSCYYSGNARTGYDHGYVQKVFASMGASGVGDGSSGSASPIPLAEGAVAPGSSSPSRRKLDTWESVFAARISAPEARRTQDFAEVSPLVPEDERPPPSAVPSEPPAATPAPPSVVAAAAVPGAGSDTAETSPEARFMTEMRLRAQASEPSPAVVGQGDSGVNSALDAAPIDDELQQSSKRQVSDAARVF